MSHIFLCELSSCPNTSEKQRVSYWCMHRITQNIPLFHYSLHEKGKWFPVHISCSCFCIVSFLIIWQDFLLKILPWITNYCSIINHVIISPLLLIYCEPLLLFNLILSDFPSVREHFPLYRVHYGKLKKEFETKPEKKTSILIWNHYIIGLNN